MLLDSYLLSFTGMGHKAVLPSMNIEGKLILAKIQFCKFIGSNIIINTSVAVCIGNQCSDLNIGQQYDTNTLSSAIGL